MTIIEVKNQLVSHFIENTFFGGDHIEGIKVGSGLERFRASLVRAAFDDLVKIDMVKEVKDEQGNAGWILTRPFDAFTQDTPLSPRSRETIANTVNGFIMANELDWPPVDKMDLQEPDLLALVDIIHEMLEMHTDLPPDFDPDHDRN